MTRNGDIAPEFTAPLANGEVEEFTLSDALADGPVVLAFFPGAFTRVCSHEMTAFQDRLDEFDERGVQLYGVSIDTPFSQNAFREELGLEFPLISDPNRELIEQYDVSIPFPEYGIDQIADRAVFVIDEDRRVTYAWVADDARNEPDYDEVEDAIEAVA